ncbi:MAG: 2-hydroxyacid dehydrogenase [Proteobacteria bacterium]|nr:2-hydroxyacid dehydrogenase [Pseudomonadota bacterium]
MPLPCALQIGQFPTAQQSVIDRELQRYGEQDAERDEAVRARVQAIITRSNYQVPASWLERLPRLKVIATSGVGFDGIPVAAARAAGIVVTHTPGVLDAAVCELAIGLLLSLLRRIPAADQFVRSEAWTSQLFPLTSSLEGKRVGIVGLGRIGRGIAQRLAGFGVEMAYCGSTRQEVPYGFFQDIRALAEYADILMVCCPGGEKTRHLINAEVLGLLGPQGFLVNVSRGTVVDERALIEALATGGIRGAALDVFAAEPLANSRLAALPNVVLTPHAGSATEETRQTMLRLALDNIHRVLAGRSALTPVPSP